MPLTLSPDAQTFVLDIPLQRHRSKGHLTIIAPDIIPPLETRLNLRALKLVATGVFWQTQLENGVYPSMHALAEAKGLQNSYVWKVVRLAFLDPSLIRDLLDGKQPPGFTLSVQMIRDLPIQWHEQRRLWR